MGFACRISASRTGTTSKNPESTPITPLNSITPPKQTRGWRKQHVRKPLQLKTTSKTANTPPATSPTPPCIFLNNYPSPRIIKAFILITPANKIHTKNWNRWHYNLNVTFYVKRFAFDVYENLHTKWRIVC